MKSKRVWRHDLQLLALVALLLAAVGGHLASTLGGAAQGGSGWRRIDTAAVRARVRSGELSDHEARWYHAGAGRKRHEP